jgi:hypothetical protein
MATAAPASNTNDDYVSLCNAMMTLLVNNHITLPPAIIERAKQLNISIPSSSISEAKISLSTAPTTTTTTSSPETKDTSASSSSSSTMAATTTTTAAAHHHGHGHENGNGHNISGSDVKDNPFELEWSAPDRTLMVWYDHRFARIHSQPPLGCCCCCCCCCPSYNTIDAHVIVIGRRSLSIV